MEAPASGALHQADRPMARLFAYLRAYQGRLLWASGSSVLNKILDLMPPLLVGWVIDSLRGTPPAWIARAAGTSDPWRMAVVLAGDPERQSRKAGKALVYQEVSGHIPPAPDRHLPGRRTPSGGRWPWTRQPPSLQIVKEQDCEKSSPIAASPGIVSAYSS